MSGSNEINNTNTREFVVSPNPATNIFVISNLELNDEIFLYNVVGKLLFKTISNGAELNIEANNLKPGIYFIMVSGLSPKKIIKIENE